MTKPNINALHNLCNAMRAFEKTLPSHDDLIFVNAVYADMLKNCRTLGDSSASVAVDLCDEITGQIEQDQIEQEKEVAWSGREIPGFGDLRGQLDALTVYQAAA